MEKDELLATLRTEMLLTEARARGAREAYQSEAISQARKLVNDKHGIHRGDKIIVHYSNGDFVYEYKSISWGWKENEPVLTGKRILKSGKPSKQDLDYDICGISYIHQVRKHGT